MKKFVDTVSKPLVSIVTPCLNGDQYIKECIDSVSSQGCSANIEHIVVDGGSTDNTIEILKQQKDLVWISEEDSGQSDAFNKGIKMAKGEWIVILDGDDVLLPGALKLYLSAINRDKNLDIIYGHTQFIDEKSNWIRNVVSVPFCYEYLIYDLAMPPSSGLMIRSEFIKENLFDINHHFNMDTEWYLRCGRGLRAKVVNNYTIAFRFWGGNKTNVLFEKGVVPDEIVQERRALDEKYKQSYVNNVSSFRIIKLVNYYYFKVLHYRSKIIQKFLLIFRIN